jgi:FixJ family two-component response regulator
MVSCVHVIDPDVRRRARISRELHTRPLHVEIYENVEEFADVAPDDGLVL